MKPRRERRSPDVLVAADRSLREVFEADYNRLVNASRALVDDRCEAEDIVQEAFARSYLLWQKKGIPVEPAAYMRVAVINLSRNHFRRKLRGLPRKPELGDHPEQAAIDRSEHDQVIAAISSLPRRQRECVALRYFLDASVIEAAETLKISEGSVKTHTHRALRALEALLILENS